MKLIANEYLKLLSKNIFILFLAFAFCANLLFLIITQLSDTENNAIISNKQSYEDLINECKNAGNKNEFINSLRIETEIALIINRHSRINNNSFSAESSFDEYRENYPTEYENACVLDLSQEELQCRSIMIENLASQLLYIDSYNEFISNIDNRAQEISGFSVFSNSDSFSYKNIEKTPKDFAKVRNVIPEIGNNKAIDIASQFQLTDYLLIFLIALVCIIMFSFEREKGLYNLICSTQKGRLPTILSKLFVVISVTIIMSIIFYLSNFLLCGMIFGFGDLERCIQSSSTFMNCVFYASISGYFFLWLIGKTVLLCAIAMLILLVFVVVKNPAKTYITLGVLFVFELYACFFIDENSTFSSLKYINIFYLLNGNNIFGYYQNVNIFSEPINIVSCFVVLSVFLILIGVFGSCMMFSKTNHYSRHSVLLYKIGSFINRNRKIKGRVSIYHGEAYKHYKTSLALLAIVLLSMLGAFSVTSDLDIVFQSVEESSYNEYMQTLEGTVDEETYNYINEQRQYFDGLVEKQNEILQNNLLSYDEKESQISSIQNIIDGKGRAFEDICEQLAYAEGKAGALKTMPCLVNEVVNKRLVKDTFREWEYFTLLIAAIVFCSSNIFACEHKNSMINLLRANKHGKCRLLVVKLITVISTSVIAYILIYLPYFINYINTFGTKSFDLPIAFVRDFGALESKTTVIQYIFIASFIHMLLALTATVFIYMLSFIMKNNLSTMMISSGVLLIPCLLFLNNDQVRIVSAFKNNYWSMALIILVVLCSLVIIASLSVAFVKYNFKR